MPYNTLDATLACPIPSMSGQGIKAVTCRRVGKDGMDGNLASSVKVEEIFYYL